MSLIPCECSYGAKTSMKKKRLKAFEATVYLGQGLSISSFLVEGKTVRYGTECVSLLVGHARNYLGRLIPDEEDFSQDTKKPPKKLEALQGKGFTGYKVPVTAPRPNGGATNADTISLDDFAIFVEYEAIVEKTLKRLHCSRQLLKSCCVDGLKQLLVCLKMI